MTKQEIVQLMAIIREFYPTYYRNKTEEETKVSARLWWDMFQEDDGMQVLAAVKAFVATDTKGFPPSVGQIKQRLVQLQIPDIPLCVHRTQHRGVTEQKKQRGENVNGVPALRKQRTS